MQHAGHSMLRSRRGVAPQGPTRPRVARARLVCRRVASPLQEELVQPIDLVETRRSLSDNLNDNTGTAPLGHPDSVAPTNAPHVHAAAAAAVEAAITQPQASTHWVHARAPRVHAAAAAAVAAAITQPRLARGDLVVGRILSTGAKGARVALLDPHLQGITGFMTDKSTPLAAEAPGGAYQRLPATGPRALPVGAVRQFLVRNVPEDMAAGGRGPLLSAWDVDQRVAWARAQQVAEVCQREGANVMATVRGHNPGGLVVSLLGLKAFIPFGRMAKPRGAYWDTAAAEALVGSCLEAAIIECDPAATRLTLSTRQAAVNRARGLLQPGALVRGWVRDVSHSCVNVELEGGVAEGLRGLLHVSKISCDSVADARDVFAAGDPLVALVAGEVTSDRPLQLSTAHLEAAPGDMLTNKGKVYEGAAQQAARVVAQMAGQQEQR